MNPRLELYLSGASITTRFIYIGGGKRVAVLEPARRRKIAVAALIAAGWSARAAGRMLDGSSRVEGGIPSIKDKNQLSLA